METIIQGKQSFYIGARESEPQAIITYELEDDQTIVANGTFVEESLRGRGIAAQLLNRLVDYARENGLKIRPLCSYVVHTFETDAAYDDVKLPPKP